MEVYWGWVIVGEDGHVMCQNFPVICFAMLTFYLGTSLGRNMSFQQGKYNAVLTALCCCG